MRRRRRSDTGPALQAALRRRLRPSTLLARVQVAPQRGDDERVIDLTRDEHAFEVGNRHEHDLRDLVACVLDGPLELRAGRIETVQAIREQSRIGVYDAKRSCRAHAVTRLLETLADRARGRLLAGLDETARHLERDALCAVAILSDENGLVVGGDGKNLQ